MAGEDGDSAGFSAPEDTHVNQRNFKTGRRDEKGRIKYAPAELDRMSAEAKKGFEQTGGYFPGKDNPYKN